MQTLFEDGALKATTLIKKKLMPDFVQMRYLLNKFCRLQAIQSVDEGKFFEHLARNSPRKTGENADKDLEEWLVVIGKKIDIDPHLHENAPMGEIRAATDSISFSKKERLSFVISKQTLEDFKSNPNQSNLFEKVEVKKGEQTPDLSRKSFANQSSGVNDNRPSQGKKRPRHATDKPKK